MLTVSLLWAGASLLAGSEVVRFLIRQGGPASLEVESDVEASAEAREEAGDSGETRVGEPVDPQAQALADSNHTLGYTVGGLAVYTIGGLVHPLIGGLALPLIVIAVVPPAKRAWAAAKRSKRLTYAGLELFQAGVELALGQLFLTAGGWLLYASGARVLIATRRKVEKTIVSASPKEPEVWVVRDGVELLTPYAEIDVGERVVLRTGDAVPVDGVIVEGWVGVDERALTGEAQIVEQGLGQRLLAGSEVISGDAVLEAQRTGADTTKARVEELLAHAKSYEQHISARVSRVTEGSVRPTVVLATLGLALHGPLGIVAGLWTNCTDMAWMSAPYSMLNTIDVAARHGLVIKDARTLEIIADVDTVIFDKTGTLTCTEFEVLATVVEGELPALEVLRVAAAIEQYQSHPLARAIVKAASRDPRPLPSTEGSRTEIGYGVRGRAGGYEVLIGSARLLEAEGIGLGGRCERALREAKERGNTAVLIALDGRCAGLFEFGLEARPEAPSVVRALLQRGLEVIIVSGDDEASTRPFADSLGVDRFIADALPEDKHEVITALQREGRVVCFVGDGINDALAMHSANLSVSLEGAASVAVQSAQIILTSGTLERLPALFLLGDDFALDQDVIINSSLAATALNAFGFIFAGFNVAALLSVYGVGLTVNVVAATLPYLRGYGGGGGSPWVRASAGSLSTGELR